jgi:hypothetical protein
MGNCPFVAGPHRHYFAGGSPSPTQNSALGAPSPVCPRRPPTKPPHRVAPKRYRSRSEPRRNALRRHYERQRPPYPDSRLSLPIANLGDRPHPHSCRPSRTRTAALPGESLKVPMIQQLSAVRNLAASISWILLHNAQRGDSSLRRVQGGDTMKIASSHTIRDEVAALAPSRSFNHDSSSQCVYRIRSDLPALVLKMKSSVEAARREVQRMAELGEEIPSKPWQRRALRRQSIQGVKPQPPARVRRLRPRSDHHSILFRQS